jgi:3-deoxy-D-manno-octulosonate 8-phosphate phosphatase (KDO 8-P phosphatase)
VSQGAGTSLELFEKAGGEILTPPALIVERLAVVRAVLFDWDGVFTDGSKNADGHSRFSEVDAMGSNLLRFALWRRQRQMPVIAIITGEDNPAAQALARREHFDAVMTMARNKAEAFGRFCQRFGLQPREVLFCFDDVLDLSVAEACGVRLMIAHRGGPLLRHHVRQHALADYVTAQPGGSDGLREAAELVMGLLGSYDEVVRARMSFGPEYREYLDQRAAVTCLVQP